MPEQGKQTQQPVERRRLDSLIDKLVSVQLDLQPLCRDDSPRPRPQRVETTIAAACDVLQSAIDDLRDIIHALGDTGRNRPT